MAGNVPLFTPPGTTDTLVAGCARHVATGGLLIAGFQLTAEYGIVEYDREAGAAGMELAERFATWDRDPYTGGKDYAVSVHRRPAATASSTVQLSSATPRGTWMAVATGNGMWPRISWTHRATGTRDAATVTPIVQRRRRRWKTATGTSASASHGTTAPTIMWTCLAPD